MQWTFGDTRFELRITGYQLPEGVTGDGFHCLDVDGDVRHLRGDWRFQGRFFSISQLTELADWLESVATGARPDPVLCGGFIDYCLRFAIQTDGPTDVLRVTFNCCVHPPWQDADPAFLDFPLVEADLRSVAVSLREQLRAYPPRVWP